MNFKINQSEVIFKGKVFEIQVDQIEYKTGNTGVREIVRHNGGAVVVPVLENGKIVLVKQYRYPFDEYLLELPAGKLDNNEDPLECARRELTEETGYSTEIFRDLGKIYTSPGFCSEILYFYLATDLKAGDHNREEGEYGMEVFKFSLEEINEKITSGEIVDAKTICGISYYQNLLLKK